jgi:hypothetical protein
MPGHQPLIYGATWETGRFRKPPGGFFISGRWPETHTYDGLAIKGTGGCVRSPVSLPSAWRTTPAMVVGFARGHALSAFAWQADCSVEPA